MCLRYANTLLKVLSIVPTVTVATVAAAGVLRFPHILAQAVAIGFVRLLVRVNHQEAKTLGRDPFEDLSELFLG